MRVIGTIIQIQGRGTFGSSGGVTVQLDKGAIQYHPFSRLRTHLGDRPPAIGVKVEILEKGAAWQTIYPDAEMPPVVVPSDLHPDSHPEPPPAAVPRVPRTAQRPTERMPEPTVLDLILAEAKITNQLLRQLLEQTDQSG